MPRFNNHNFIFKFRIFLFSNKISYFSNFVKFKKINIPQKKTVNLEKISNLIHLLLLI